MISRASSEPATILRTMAASSVGSPRPFITVYVSTASSVSPFTRSAALWPLERPRREMGLEAGYAKTADDRVVRRSGRQLESVPGLEIDRVAGCREPETDRPALDGDHLVVGVVVRRVALARCIAPDTGV